MNESEDSIGSSFLFSPSYYSPSFQIVVSPTFESVEVQKGVISKLDAKKNEGKLLDEITRNKSQG